MHLIIRFIYFVLLFIYSFFDSFRSVQPISFLQTLWKADSMSNKRKNNLADHIDLGENVLRRLWDILSNLYAGIPFSPNHWKALFPGVAVAPISKLNKQGPFSHDRTYNGATRGQSV